MQTLGSFGCPWLQKAILPAQETRLGTLGLTSDHAPHHVQAWASVSHPCASFGPEP